MDLPEVKAFNAELSGLYDNKPPISKAKMSAITRGAIKAIKVYKHVVHSVEKFIQKCKPEYKVPGLYVIDSIVRQSRHQFGQDKDVFAPRFAKNMQQTFANLFRCPPEDKRNIIRVLNLWQKNNVFSPQVIQPLLDMADPNHPLHQEIQQQQNNTANGSSLNISHNTMDGKSSPGPAPLHSPHTSSPMGDQFQDQPSGQGVKFNRKLLNDFEYESEDDGPAEAAAHSSTHSTHSTQSAHSAQAPQHAQHAAHNNAHAQHPQHPTQHNTADALGSILTNPEIMRQLQSLQAQMQLMTGMQIPNLMPMMSDMQMQQTQNQNPFLTSQPEQQKEAKDDIANESDIEFVETGPQVIEIPDANDSRSPSPRSRRARSRSKSPRRRRRSRSRSARRRRDRDRDRDKDREKDREKTYKEREAEREKQREREKKGLPPIKKENLSVCSTTLWVGHLSKLATAEELSDLFGGVGGVASIDLVPPRGCAFVVMERRRDAARALRHLHKHKLHSKEITVAWAPGRGVKGREWKDHWEGEVGVSYLPWGALHQRWLLGALSLDALEDGGAVDEDTLPPWLPPRILPKSMMEIPMLPGMPPVSGPGMLPAMPPGAMATMPPGAMPAMPPGALPAMPPGALPAMPPGTMTTLPPGVAGALPPTGVVPTSVGGVGGVVSLAAAPAASVAVTRMPPPGMTATLPPGLTAGLPPGIRPPSLPAGVPGMVGGFLMGMGGLVGGVLPLHAAHPQLLPHPHHAPPQHPVEPVPTSAAGAVGGAVGGADDAMELDNDDAPLPAPPPAPSAPALLPDQIQALLSKPPPNFNSAEPPPGFNASEPPPFNAQAQGEDKEEDRKNERDRDRRDRDRDRDRRDRGDRDRKDRDRRDRDRGRDRDRERDDRRDRDRDRGRERRDRDRDRDRDRERFGSRENNREISRDKSPRNTGNADNEKSLQERLWEMANGKPNSQGEKHEEFPEEREQQRDDTRERPPPLIDRMPLRHEGPPPAVMDAEGEKAGGAATPGWTQLPPPRHPPPHMAPHFRAELRMRGPPRQAMAGPWMDGPGPGPGPVPGPGPFGPRFNGMGPPFNRPPFERPPFEGGPLFEGPPRFERPPFNRIPFEMNRLPFEGPRPPFDGPRPPFDGPRPPFDGPRPPFDGPRPHFDGSRAPFDGPRAFDGPPFDGDRSFDGPPRYDGPPEFFDRNNRRFEDREQYNDRGWNGDRDRDRDWDRRNEWDDRRRDRRPREHDDRFRDRNDRRRTFDDRSGERPGGDRPSADRSSGDRPGGDRPGGDRPGGDRPGGDRSGGDRPGGDRSGGDRPGGDRPGGDRPGGDRSGGDRPGGDRSGGDRSGGERPGGDRPSGDRPGGDRTGADRRSTGPPAREERNTRRDKDRKSRWGAADEPVHVQQENVPEKENNQSEEHKAIAMETEQKVDNVDASRDEQTAAAPERNEAAEVPKESVEMSHPLETKETFVAEPEQPEGDSRAPQEYEPATQEFEPAPQEYEPSETPAVNDPPPDLYDAHEVIDTSFSQPLPDEQVYSQPPGEKESKVDTPAESADIFNQEPMDQTEPVPVNESTETTSTEEIKEGAA